MSDTINLNNDTAVTVIKEVGGVRVITQFKNYDDFIDYQERSGDIEEVMEQQAE